MDPLKIECILCARIFRGLGIEFRHIFYVYLEGYIYTYIYIYMYSMYIYISLYIYVYPHDIPVSCVRLTVPLSLLLLFLPWHQSMIRPPPPAGAAGVSGFKANKPIISTNHNFACLYKYNIVYIYIVSI